MAKLSNVYLPNKLKHQLHKKLEKVEFKKTLLSVFRVILILSAVLAIFSVVYSYSHPIFVSYRLANKIVIAISTFIISFALYYGLLWVLFNFYIDMQIYKRIKTIEANLPDYLEFTSANLRAGMPIDKALWLSIRPRFGPLATEMERVAKDTMSGEELSLALKKFANKYDSPTLQRSVSLINEGLEAGGKISDLISKIAMNLDEVAIIKKEISASVMNYIIFIGFAAVIAAPILFSLCSMLLVIISGLGQIMPTGAATGMQTMPVNFFQSGISTRDFHIYAYMSLGVTAIFSSMIVSIIQKGGVKDGLKYIPIFMISSLTLFTIARKILESLFGGIV